MTFITQTRSMLSVSSSFWYSFLAAVCRPLFKPAAAVITLITVITAPVEQSPAITSLPATRDTGLVFGDGFRAGQYAAPPLLPNAARLPLASSHLRACLPDLSPNARCCKGEAVSLLVSDDDSHLV